MRNGQHLPDGHDTPDLGSTSPWANVETDISPNLAETKSLLDPKLFSRRFDDSRLSLVCHVDFETTKDPIGDVEKALACNPFVKSICEKYPDWTPRRLAEVGLGSDDPPILFSKLPNNQLMIFLEKEGDHKGANGVVCFSLEEGNENVFLSKRMILSGNPDVDQKRKQKFIREGKLMKKIGAPAVAEIAYFLTEGGIPRIVMKLHPGVLLEDIVSSAEKLGLPPQAVMIIGREIATALTKMHKGHHLHGDIKRTNILITDQGEKAILLDLGESKEEGDMSLTRTGESRGTAFRNAPETFGDAKNDTTFGDIYALGREIASMARGGRDILSRTEEANRETLAELYNTATRSGRLGDAQEYLNKLKVFEELQQARVRPLNSHYPDEFVELLCRMLSNAPEQRPSAEEISRVLGQLTKNASLGLEPPPMPENNLQISAFGATQREAGEKVLAQIIQKHGPLIKQSVSEVTIDDLTPVTGVRRMEETAAPIIEETKALLTELKNQKSGAINKTTVTIVTSVAALALTIWMIISGRGEPEKKNEKNGITHVDDKKNGEADPPPPPDHSHLYPELKNPPFRMTFDRETYEFDISKEGKTILKKGPADFVRFVDETGKLRSLAIPMGKNGPYQQFIKDFHGIDLPVEAESTKSSLMYLHVLEDHPRFGPKSDGVRVINTGKGLGVFDPHTGALAQYPFEVLQGNTELPIRKEAELYRQELLSKRDISAITGSAFPGADDAVKKGLVKILTGHYSNTLPNNLSPKKEGKKGKSAEKVTRGKTNTSYLEEIRNHPGNLLRPRSMNAMTIGENVKSAIRNRFSDEVAVN